jgi:predicted nucleotidyltransferase
MMKEKIYEIIKEKIKTEKIIFEKVSYIYLYGSSVYQSNQKGSDYDVCVVVEDLKSSFIKEYKEDETEISICYEKQKSYMKEINKNSLFYLVSVWLPQEYIFYKSEKMKLFLDTFVVDCELLIKDIDFEENLCTKKSKNFYQKGIFNFII